MKRIITAGISFLLILLSIALLLFFPGRTKSVEDKIVVEVWHTDSFEGGKGSRGNFLKEVAAAYEKQHESVLFRISVYTPTGVEEGLKSGVVPDMVSFSCGVEGVLPVAGALPYSFGGGIVDRKCYAVPWCAGRYFLFCKEEEFSAITEETVLVSVGGNNQVLAAAAMLGLKKYKAEDSVSAYTDFLKGEYRYMLGTQRDVCRFAVRGENVATMSVSLYADLYQYMSVTSGAHREICLDFLKFLLSEKTQADLGKIGMFPYKAVGAEYTLSPFVEKKGLNELKKEAERAIVNGDTKILKTFLKPLS